MQSYCASIAEVLIVSLRKAFQIFLNGFRTGKASQITFKSIESAPCYIAAWISQKCEQPDPQNPQTAYCQGTSFSYALKMRTDVSYHYAQQAGRGSHKCHQDRQRIWLKILHFPMKYHTI